MGVGDASPFGEVRQGDQSPGFFAFKEQLEFDSGDLRGFPLCLVWIDDDFFSWQERSFLKKRGRGVWKRQDQARG